MTHVELPGTTKQNVGKGVGRNASPSPKPGEVIRSDGVHKPGEVLRVLNSVNLDAVGDAAGAHETVTVAPAVISF